MASEKSMTKNVKPELDPTPTAGQGEAVSGEEEGGHKIPIGMLGDYKSLYQKKDNDGRYQWSLEEPTNVVDAAEGSNTTKFAFLIRRKKPYDSRKKYDIDSVIVQSPLLKNCVGVALKDYPGITTTLDRLVFSAPFHPFVHRWAKLVRLLDARVTEDVTTRQHLQLFHDILYEELKEAIHAKTDLVKNGVITFEYLWAIFEPGTLVFGTEDGKERIYHLQSASVAVDGRRGVEYLQLQVWCVDWDGGKFGKSYSYLSVYQFEGTAQIISIGTFPLEFHPQKQQLTERLIIRGRIFERYAGYHYQAYQGVALGYGRCGMIKYNLDSRIIVDCDAHNKFLPNHAVQYNALGKSTVMLDLMVSDSEEGDSDDFCDVDSVNNGYVSTPETNGSDEKRTRHRPLTQAELLLAVPYVRGYAIKLKKWLWFFVDQITPIKFNTNAFDQLVLPGQQKTLIRAFAESQIKYKDTFDDIITGKGRGMIMLLAGSPGVGKTLTAESVAEDMKVPLYMMSAGDLGLDPTGIENALNTVMDMVSKWRAVLLLDEADVFLEARSTHDLERNKMVSIFLRVLEYYEGILFLTTNRINNIDDAFHSRIHVTINYPDLAPESRRLIWRTFLGADTAVREAELDKLAQVDLNGRQIKNLLKTAQLLARSEVAAGQGQKSKSFGGKVDMRHIVTVLAIEKGISWKWKGEAEDAFEDGMGLLFGGGDALMDLLLPPSYVASSSEN